MSLESLLDVLYEISDEITIQKLDNLKPVMYSGTLNIVKYIKTHNNTMEISDDKLNTILTHKIINIKACAIGDRVKNSTYKIAILDDIKGVISNIDKFNIFTNIDLYIVLCVFVHDYLTITKFVRSCYIHDEVLIPTYIIGFKKPNVKSDCDIRLSSVGLRSRVLYLDDAQYQDILDGSELCIIDEPCIGISESDEENIDTLNAKYNKLKFTLYTLINKSLCDSIDQPPNIIKENEKEIDILQKKIGYFETKLHYMDMPPLEVNPQPIKRTYDPIQSTPAKIAKSIPQTVYNKPVQIVQPQKPPQIHIQASLKTPIQRTPPQNAQKPVQNAQKPVQNIPVHVITPTGQIAPVPTTPVKILPKKKFSLPTPKRLFKK